MYRPLRPSQIATIWHLTKVYSAILCFHILAALCLSSCFALREPDAPAGPSTFTPPNQPEILMANFSTAVANADVVNYERCFVKEGFTFVPDPNVATNNRGLFENWTLQNHELEYMRNLQRIKIAGVPNRVIITNPKINNFTADSVEYIANYELGLNLQDTVFGSKPLKGNIILTLVRNTFNEWAIRRWTDNQTTQNQCWTKLKEKYVAR